MCMHLFIYFFPSICVYMWVCYVHVCVYTSSILLWCLYMFWCHPQLTDTLGKISLLHWNCWNELDQRNNSEARTRGKDGQNEEAAVVSAKLARENRPSGDRKWERDSDIITIGFKWDIQIQTLLSIECLGLGFMEAWSGRQNHCTGEGHAVIKAILIEFSSCPSISSTSYT